MAGPHQESSVTAIPIQVADAVVAEINSAADDDLFSIGKFTSQRSYADWDMELSDLEDMAVDVVFVTAPRDDDIKLNAAGELAYRVSVDVVVRKRFKQEDRRTNSSRLKNEAVDPLVLLLQEIYEHLASKRNTGALPTMTSAKWLEPDIKSWLGNWRLRQAVFEGDIRCHFDVSKEG